MEADMEARGSLYFGSSWRSIGKLVEVSGNRWKSMEETHGSYSGGSRWKSVEVNWKCYKLVEVYGSLSSWK